MNCLLLDCESLHLRNRVLTSEMIVFYKLSYDPDGLRICGKRLRKVTVLHPDLRTLILTVSNEIYRRKKSEGEKKKKKICLYIGALSHTKIGQVGTSFACLCIIVFLFYHIETSHSSALSFVSSDSTSRTTR